MANLFELLINKFQKQPQELQLVENTGEQAQVPELKLTSVSPATNYNAYNQPEAQPKAGLFNNIAGIGDKMQDGLFGKMVSAPDTVDTDNMSATVNAPVRQGGFLNDLSAGWQDNTQNGFKVDNLLPDENKTWATRLGEGLGTAARFVNSPLGRGIITGGIVAATGGNPLQSLVYGGQAGVTNQQNVLKDKVYRERLLDAEKQNIINTTRLDSNDWTNIKAQLDSNAEYVNADDATKEKILSTTAANFLTEKQDKLIADAENSINNIRGYLGDDTFRQVLAAQTMRENADWKRMYYDNQQKQNEFNNDFKVMMAKWQQDEKNQARADKQRDFEYKKYNDDRNYDLKLKEAEAKIDKKNKGTDFSLAYSIIDEIEGLYKKLPQNYMPAGTRKAGATLVGLASQMGLDNNNMAAFKAIDNGTISLMLRQLGEKGTLSDGDVKRGMKLTPKAFDSPGQAMAKTKALRELFKKAETNSAKGINYNSNAKQIGKYKVTVVE